MDAPLRLAFPHPAHVAVEGWSDLANGAIHPLVNPAQMLVVAGLALLLGAQVPLRVKRPLVVFASTAAIALGLTPAGISGEVWQPVLCAIALCLGGVVALGRPVPPLLVDGFCLIAAVALGLDSGVETAGWVAVLKTLVGTLFGLILLTFYTALASSNATGKPWAVAGVRILGSWIVAISLMVLAFSLTGKGG